MHTAAGPLELAVYALVVGTAAVQLAYKGYLFSLNFEKGGRWHGYAPGLQQGWLWGRSVDLSDTQWREFRGGMGLLAAAFTAFAAASWLQRGILSTWQPSGSKAVRDARWGAVLGFRPRYLNSQAALRVGMSLLFLGCVHGVAAVFPLSLATASYLLGNLVAGRRHGAAAIWGFNVAALLAARVWDGFRFGHISPSLGYLDAHRGPMRWEICFNLSMLRMLSFSLDMHWRAQQAQRGGTSQGSHQSPHTVQQDQPRSQGALVHLPQTKAYHNGVSGSDEDASGPVQPRGRQQGARWRQASSLPSQADYGFLDFLAYVFYPPLYLAGAIMTYQDFAWQLRQPVKLRRIQVLAYAVRFAADWACLELVTHLLYFKSVAKHRLGVRYKPLGLQYGPLETVLTGFWVLCFMWLKFATIWRFFRLAALLDGIEPPENMRRCFANNYDVEGFFKGWHCSFNAWLVRYMYIPLGGTKYRLLNIWPIFFFVAVWHDLEWRLLAWAWLVCLAFAPELLVKRAAASQRLAPWRQTALFRHAAAGLAALNIGALMAANLAGYVLGLGGVRELASQLLQQPLLMAATFLVFYCAVQLMFWLRCREELSAGW